MAAAFDRETEATLAQLARFLPEAERPAAREAAVYAILMTESDLSPGSAMVAAWCYEYASRASPRGSGRTWWRRAPCPRTRQARPRRAPTPARAATPSRRASRTRARYRDGARAIP